MSTTSPAVRSAAAATTVAILTPPGRGAVATVRVAGPAALECVAGLFHAASGRSVVELPPERIVFGRWHSLAGEEVVVARQAHDAFEIHCHGGLQAPRAIADSLLARGCLEISWQAWSEQQSSDRWQLAALQALSAARTERTAAILLDQYAGAWRRELEQLQSCLSARDAQAASERVDHLLQYSKLALHLTTPWRVMLAGRPNVGKSSLMNALVGYERSIVHDVPGTTRDLVAATTAVDGWPVELFDTAGLRATSEPLEAAGVALTSERLPQADLVLLVFDASQPWTDEDAELQSAWPQALVVYSKCDLVEKPKAESRKRNTPEGLVTSAKLGTGIAELAAAMAAKLVPSVPQPSSAVPFNSECVQLLQDLCSKLSCS